MLCAPKVSILLYCQVPLANDDVPERTRKSLQVLGKLSVH